MSSMSNLFTINESEELSEEASSEYFSEIKENTPPEYNLILDLDGTLISIVQHNEYHLVKARPHLSYFLHYVFSNFKRVSIWTNASTNWFLYCYINILEMNMPKGSEFDLVITLDNGIIPKKMLFDETEYAKINGMYQDHLPKNMYVKNLEFLYELYPNYNSKNTFIIDDMPFTYCMNPKNAIPITPYEYNDDHIFDIEDDTEFIRIIYQMKHFMFDINVNL